VALRTSALVAALSTLLYYPLALPLTTLARGLVRLLGGTEGERRPSVTEEYIKQVIDTGEEQGQLTAPDARMLRRVFDLSDLTVNQIMVPRPDIIAVEAQEPLSRALALAIEHKQSRLPVYEGSLDHVVGILHAKDLLPRLRAGAMGEPCARVARPVAFVPETQALSDLLSELQRRRALLAVVVDEFGGTAGVVTVEDVLEQIVGEILDETDVAEPDVVPVGEGAFSCKASVPLHELEDVLEQRLPEHVDTLGGLVYDLAGRIPEEGDVFEYENLRLTVQAMDGTRIEQVLVQRQAPEEEG